MVENAPSSVDLQEFQFKLHSKLKIFENNDDSKFKNAYSLVAAASRYGLVFVGSPNGTLEVIQLKSIENSSVTKVESTNFPKRSVPLSAVPSHLAVNCDQTLLAVICYKNDCAIAIVYNVTSFFSQNVVVVREIRVSATPGVLVLEAGWNPTMPGVLTACKADGSLGVYSLTDTGVEINELPVAAAARCFCWSPKGKQLVVGSTNGSLTQYKPDLKAVKMIAAPGLAGAGPYCTLSVCWVSNYQFVAVYRDMGNQEARPYTVIVNAPKTGPTTYINYEDICYSGGTLRPPQYYIIHQPTWGIMLISSANSMELGVLGLTAPGDPALWQQWTQVDAGRAELPLSSAHQDTFPVGVALDTGVTTQIPCGENQLLPPMPLVHLLSHHGVLCSFSVINMREGAQGVCRQPEGVGDMSGVGAFVQQVQAKPPPTSTPLQPTFGAPASTAPTFGAPASTAPTFNMPLSAPTFGAPASSAPTFGAPTSAAPTYSLPRSAAPNFNLPTSTPNFNFPATSTPNFNLPTSTPTFNLPASSAPTFGSLAGAPPPAFGAPASIAASAPAAAANASFMSSASQPGSLPGWTAGSTLFGAGTPPSFGNLAAGQTSQPAAMSTPAFNFKVGDESTAAKSAPATAASTAPTAPGLGSGGNLGGMMGGMSVASSAPSTTPSMFGSLSTPPTPSVSKPPAPTPSMFGSLSTPPAPSVSKSAAPTPSMFGSLSTSPAPSVSKSAASSPSMFGSLSTPPAPSVSKPAASTPSMFGSLSTPPAASVSKSAASTPSMFGLGSNAPSYGAINMSTSKPVTPSATVAPVASSPANVSTPQVSKPLLSTPKPPPKPDIIPQQQQTPSNVESSKKDESVLNDQMVQGLIKEEVRNFQSELQELFKRCKSIKLDVGTDEEKTNLVLTTESLLEFYTELQETTDSQVAEVHYLKQALMQSFAWYEDTKARHRRYTDPNFASLLQAQELDPISEKQFGDIKHLIYYIEAQLKQVDSFLDNEWADFQDSCKKQVKGKLKIPTLEPIYQSLVRQNAILDKHRYLLKDIAARIKSKNKKATAYPSVMNLNITNNKNNEIDEELRKLKIDHEDLFTARYDKMLKQKNKFTETKQAKLCSFFTNRNVIHIVPKKPKFVNTPSKLTSFTTSLVQRNLNKSFDKLDLSLNNSVEANFNASNLFSFQLLDGAHSTKIRSPEKQKPVMNLTFNSPKPDVQQIKPIVPASTTNKVASNVFNLSSVASNIPSSSVFSFTATSTLVTQSYGSGDSNTQPLMFTGATNNTKPQPVTKFGLSSQINTNFNLKPVETKEIAVSKPETLIKPTVQKTSTAEPSTMFDTKLTTQPFTFLPPQPKPATTISSVPDSSSSKQSAFGDSTIIAPKPTSGFATPRDSIEPGFNFGGALSLGQQSTPKPKSTGTMNFGQVSVASVTKPVATVATTSITTTVATQIVAPKPTFGLAQSPAASNLTPVTKSEPAATSVPSTAPSIFGGLTAKTTTVGTFFGQQASLASTTTAGSFFGSISAAPTSVSGSLFSTKPAQQSEKPTVSVSATSTTIASPATPATPTIAASTGFSFTQAAAEPAKSASIFGGAPGTTGFATTATTTTATSSIATGFSFIQPVANIASSVATTAVAASAATPKITSVFSMSDNKTAEPPASIAASPPANVAASTESSVATSSVAGSSPPTQGSTFGFGAQAATVAATTADNKFSFGNLTVSALSPSSAPSPPGTTTSVASTPGFSFASAAASVATTSTAAAATTTTSAFGGFGSSIFGKPAATTTTASFMGQPICSPSSFTQPQNSGSPFGQSTGNIFAQKPSTPSASSTSIFGQPSSGSSPFGQVASNPAVTSSSTTSIFGQTQSSPFGNSSASTASTTGGSIFGQSSSFGAATTTSGSIFGQSTFGSPAATSASTNFSFTQTAGATSGFGSSGGSIFGAKPAFGAAPAFGQPAGFGAPPAFGGSPAGGSVFGSPAPAASSPGSTFGGGFGSPSTFGQKPAFGSPPAFGQQSAFGSPPAFGGSPSFGSPNRVFGATASAPTGTFGSAVQENSTFANLASQPTLGFGSLVQNQPTPPQQQQQQQQPQFSGGAQFSSWR